MGWKKFTFLSDHVLKESDRKDFIDFLSHCDENVEIDQKLPCFNVADRFFQIVVYQEMRTLPINLVSLTERVILPLLDANYRIGLVFCLRWTNQDATATKILFDELHHLNLLQFLLRFQYNSPTVLPHLDCRILFRERTFG